MTTATLVGGPLHGKTVKVLGWNYQHLFAPPDGSLDWTIGVWEWAMDGEEWLGLFKGFFKDGKLVEVNA